MLKKYFTYNQKDLRKTVQTPRIVAKELGLSIGENIVGDKDFSI